MLIGMLKLMNQTCEAAYARSREDETPAALVLDTYALLLRRLLLSMHIYIHTLHTYITPIHAIHAIHTYIPHTPYMNPFQIGMLQVECNLHNHSIYTTTKEAFFSSLTSLYSLGLDLHKFYL